VCLGKWLPGSAQGDLSLIPTLSVPIASPSTDPLGVYTLSSISGPGTQNDPLWSLPPASGIEQDAPCGKPWPGHQDESTPLTPGCVGVGLGSQSIIQARSFMVCWGHGTQRRKAPCHRWKARKVLAEGHKRTITGWTPRLSQNLWVFQDFCGCNPSDLRAEFAFHLFQVLGQVVSYLGWQGKSSVRTSRLA
jgi:hypothetical protein